MTTNIDYINTLFENPLLTKIQRQSTHVTLRIIKDEMKSNATSVSTDLGGGANGHFGLMLTPVEYINASVIPYVRPIHPGVLHVPPRTMHHKSTRLRDEFEEELRQYR